MTTRSNKVSQLGFAAVEAVLIVVFLAGVAGVGYVVAKHRSAHKTVSTATQQTTAVTPSAPTVSKTSDLTTASSTLDQTDVDAASSDTAALDAELNNL